MPKKCCFSCFSLKSANRSGALFDFCVHIHKIVQSYFSSQSFNPKIVQSFSRKIVQSFSRSVVQPHIHILQKWAILRYMVLGSTWYLQVRGTVWCKVLCGARLAIFPVLGRSWAGPGQVLKQCANIHKKADQTNKAKKK